MSLFISYAAIFAAIFSLYSYQSMRLGLSEVLSSRLIGTYGQPNLFAGLMLIGFFSYQQLILNNERYGILYQVPSVLLAVVLFLAGSQAALLGLTLSILCVLYLVVKRRQEFCCLRSGIYALCALMLGYVVAAQIGLTTVLQRYASEVDITQGSISTYVRFNDWFSAILIGLDHPWFGVGVGNFKSVINDYQIKTVEILSFTYDSLSLSLWAHNDYLHILAENGFVVFFMFAVFICYILKPFFDKYSSEEFYLVPAFLSILVMMCFGYPFRYHAIVFVIICIVSQLTCNDIAVFNIKRNNVIMCLVVFFVVLDIFFFKHFVDMYRLDMFAEVVVSNKIVEKDFFVVGQNTLLTSSEDELYGWEFKHHLYYNLSSKSLFEHDIGLAESILPDALKHRVVNGFHTMDFALSQLYYVLGDYEKGMSYSRAAMKNRPDRDQYFNFMHLNNVMGISSSKKIPLNTLLDDSQFHELLESKVIDKSQFDENKIVILKDRINKV